MFLYLLARFILSSIGWAPLTKDQINIFTRESNLVIVFSHTSYAEFWLMLLYRLAFPSIFRHLYFVMKPGPFKNYHYILHQLGCIPSTSINKKRKGFVRRTSKMLLEQDKFILFLSPKGTRSKGKWKTGYYYIAKKTKSKVAVCGFDYEDNVFKLFEPIDIEKYKDIDFVNKKLWKDMSLITPLNLECSEIDVKVRNKNNISLFDYPCVSCVLFFLIMCVLMPNYFCVWIVGMLMGTEVHISKEKTIYTSFLDIYICSLIALHNFHCCLIYMILSGLLNDRNKPGSIYCFVKPIQYAFSAIVIAFYKLS